MTMGMYLKVEEAEVNPKKMRKFKKNILGRKIMRIMRRKSFLWGGSNPVTRLSPSFPTAYCLAEPKCQQFSTHTKMRRRMNKISNDHEANEDGELQWWCQWGGCQQVFQATLIEKLPVSSIQTVLPIFMQNICKLILYICKIITQAILWKSFQKLKCSLVNSVMQVFFKFNQILMNSTKVLSQNFQHNLNWNW